MDEQQDFTGALEGAKNQLEVLQDVMIDKFLEAFREAGLALEEFFELVEEEREYEAARRRETFIARKRRKQRRARMGY